MIAVVQSSEINGECARRPRIFQPADFVS
jgi:hypothetical protein